MPASLLSAFYLASSWLWCIGAFLPVLLLRDYGWGSLLVFTLANLAGAAAFGWVVKKRQQPGLLARHKRFLTFFSQVTIAFQVFFVAWLGVLVGEWLLLVLLALVLAFYWADRMIGWVALGLFVVSLLLFGYYVQIDVQIAGFEFALIKQEIVKQEIAELQPGWWHTLFPLVLGFALSPYLDLTFHRALAVSPNPRLSFGLGFGVFFLCLLLFVFFYSASLGELMSGGKFEWQLLWPVVAFIMMQTAFTVALHLKEMQRLFLFAPSVPSSPNPLTLPTAPSLGRQLLLLAGYGLLLLVLLKAGAFWPLPGMEVALSEALYKAFLYFYGLVFPLYLLLGSNNRSFAVALLLATPGFALGFLLGGSYLPWLSLSMLLVVAWMLLHFFYLRPVK